VIAIFHWTDEALLARFSQMNVVLPFGREVAHGGPKHVTALLSGVVFLVLCMPTSRAEAPSDVTDQNYNTVTVQGRGTSKDDAVTDALRNAVERAAGQFIHSQSQTKNAEIILDKVLAKSAGFVRRYTITNTTGPDSNGIVSIEVTAEVSTKAVATEWGEIQILLQQKGKPRLMVVISERIDGAHESESIVATQVEKQLLKNDFPLVDKSQFNEIQRRDVAQASTNEDLTKMVAVGRQFGAELVAIGTADAAFDGEEDLLGVTVYTYGATARVRVVRTDTATLLVSDNRTVRKGSRTRHAAAVDVLRILGETLARQIQDGVVAKWSREVAEGLSVNLEVSGMTFAQSTRLQSALKQLKMVKDVQPRNLVNGVALFTVDVKGTANQFAEGIASIDMHQESLDINAISINSIKAALVQKSAKEGPK
jgi:hypothetical protein